MNSISCPSCGARQSANSQQCDLCGEILPGLAAPEPQIMEPTNLVDGLTGASVSAAGGPVCEECGADNLPAARFCNGCGTVLPVPVVLSRDEVGTEEDARVPERKKEFGAVSQRTLVIVGIAVIAVLALYGITTISKTSGPASTDVPGATQAGASPSALAALDPALVAQVEQIKAKIDTLTDPALIKTERLSIVTAYTRYGRLDLAGDMQREIAEAEPTAANWAQTGHYFYDWMEMQAPGSPEKAKSAKSAIAAYKKSLEINPDDLNVRTDMGAAYMNDPDNPMLAIQETVKVLEMDPNHLQANFNRGVMLYQIQRLDEARAQFERVTTLVPPEDPVHMRALQMIEAMAGQPQLTPSPATGQ